MPIPSEEELQKAWVELNKIFIQGSSADGINLEEEGVKIPQGDRFNRSNKSIWLSVLYFYKQRYVHKDEISEIVRHFNPNAGRDQQVRHLKRDGWYIGDSSGSHKLDVTKISKEFENSSRLKNKTINAKTFEELKRAYNFCCASCGVKEGETNPRYGDEKIKLQRGHMDPSKSGSDLKNIIPQCQYCNRAYKNDFTFDKKGRVHSIASVNPVKRANQNVQGKVLDWLKSKEENSKE